MLMTCGLLNIGCIQVRRIRTRSLMLSLTGDKSLMNPETNVDIVWFDREQ